MAKKNSTLGRVYKKIETLLSVGAKTTIGLAILTAMGGLTYLALQPKDITAPTVMLTALSRGGGTGVIIASSTNESKVLTNGHVCNVLTNGGVAITTRGQRHTVAELLFYEHHDLCLATVKANLGPAADIAGRASADYSQATVSGHPRLLPNVVSTGHFSSHQIIDVWLGTKPCSYEQLRSKENIGKFCRFFRHIPVIKTYETRLVTAATMPGSSGSAIYDTSGDLSALVFAGNQATTFAVPYEYLVDFLAHPYAAGNRLVVPDYFMNVEAKINRQRKAINRQELTTKCAKAEEDIIERACDVILRDLEWRNNENNIDSGIVVLPGLTNSGYGELR